MTNDDLAESLRATAASIANDLGATTESPRTTKQRRKTTVTVNDSDPDNIEFVVRHAPIAVTPELIMLVTDGYDDATVSTVESTDGTIVRAVLPVAGCRMETDSRRIGAWFARCSCGWITGPHRSYVSRKFAQVHSARCATARDIARSAS